MKLSIVIVSFNTRELLLDCLASVYAQQPLFEREVIVVDNHSCDGSAEAVRVRFPEVRLIELPNNLGFSTGNNCGLRVARGEYCLLLNSDTVVLPGALEGLVHYLDEHSDAEAVGPRLLNSDGTFQRSFFDFPHAAKILSHSVGLTPLIRQALNAMNLKSVFRAAFLREVTLDRAWCVDYLLFACILIRRSVFDRIGLLDEKMFFYHEDCEFGCRMYAHGMRIHYYPRVAVVHHGNASARKVAPLAFVNYYHSLLYLFKKHLGWWRLLQLRVAMAVGMAVRLCLAPLGFYQSVTIPNTYGATGSPRQSDAQSKHEALSVYWSVFRMALQKVDQP
jgi:GT2 family glycosyltransferase